MKDKIIKWSSKNDVSLFCVAITAVVTVIEFVVLHFDQTYVFPFTLLAFAVMVVKIGLHVFGKSQKRTLLYLSCGTANIVMINRLFHYEKLIEIFPLLKGINQWMVLLASASSAIVIILLVRFIIWLINKPNYEHEKTVTRKAINVSAETSRDINNFVPTENLRVSPCRPKKEKISSNSKKEKKEGGTADILITVSLWAVIFTVYGISIYYFIKYPHVDTQTAIAKGLPDMFAILLKYTLFAFAILLVCMAILIITIEFAHFITARIYAMRNSTSKSIEPPKVPTNVLSISIVIIIFGLIYFNADFRIFDFINFTAAGDYLALPLELIVILISFLFLATCVNWFLKAIFEPHNGDSNSSYAIADKMKDDIKYIIRDAMDLVLNTAKTVIKFAGFIPNFFDTMYDFVFDEDCQDTLSSNQEKREIESACNEPDKISDDCEVASGSSESDPDDADDFESSSEARNDLNAEGGGDNER